MKNRFFLFCLLAALAVSCVKDQQEVIQLMTDDQEFYATIEEPGEPDTRVYANDQLRVRWDAGDHISIFNKTTYNREYAFQGETGDNSGSFKKVPNDDFFTGNDLDFIYAVYPYQESTKISDDGEITFILPAEQSYRENSFGLGANTMISVTEDNELHFKNVCGYFAVKLYGDNVSVKSISIKGNNNELLAGKATVIAQTNAVPTLQMSSAEATKELTLTCSTPVTLGSTAETATTFWFVIPPTTFTNGFTLTVKDDLGGSFVKTSSGSLEIKRNTLKRSAALKAEMEGQEPNKCIYYTSTDGKIVTPYKSNGFGARLISNEYVNGQGVMTFDGDVTSIGDHSFYDCTTLASITIPNSVTSLGECAFHGCSSLISISIPENVQTIGGSPFSSCTNLASITVDTHNTVFDSRDNCNAIIESSSNVLLSGCKNTIIPKSISRINSFAFNRCFSLVSIIIPDGVGSIGSNAFAFCTDLNYISIPDSVTSIEDSAFMGCTNLTSVVIPESTSTIGNGAFCNCTGLTSINIPDGISYIEPQTFSGCESLLSIIIPDSVSGIGYSAFSACKSLSSITIPRNVTSIESFAFAACHSLTSITVMATNPPTGDSHMFSDTNSCPIYVPFESINTYKSAYYWSDYADRIQAMPQPNNKIYYTSTDGNIVTPYNADGFGANLISNEYVNGQGIMTFDGEIDRVWSQSFMNCTNLLSITIPESVLTFEQFAFAYCSSLTSIVLPKYLGSIPYCCFAGCTNLSSIVWPQALTIICDDAFDGCRFENSNYTLELPNTVSEIGNSAFGALRHLVIPTPFQIIVTSTSFLKNYTFFYVPADLVEEYKASEFWTEYSDRIRPLGDYPVEPVLGGTVGEAVDLGLSVKWASWNVGASAPEEVGAYFAWGETNIKWDYSGDNYKWFDNNEQIYTKYTSKDPGVIDNKIVLDPEDDAAFVNWGSTWRMPTINELRELLDNCTTQRMTVNGVEGRLFTSKIEGYTDKSIFLPAAGFRDYVSLNNMGTLGRYLSSTRVAPSFNSHARALSFEGTSFTFSGFLRRYGYTIRPVLDDRIHPISLTLNKSSLSLPVGKTEQLIATISPADATDKTVSWSSDNTDVATVDSDGFVTAVAAGSAIITATTNDGNLTATCAITVNPVLTPVEYVLVKDVAELTVGSKVIIAAAAFDKAISTTQNTNNRPETAVVKEGDKIVDSGSSVEIFTVEEGTTAGTFAFKASGTEGYIYAVASKNNLKTAAAKSEEGDWTVTIADNSTVIGNTKTSRFIRYNAGSGLFSSYASTSSIKDSVAIYKLADTPTPPEKQFTLERVWGLYTTADDLWCKDVNVGGTSILHPDGYGMVRSIAMDDDYIYLPKSSAYAAVLAIKRDDPTQIIKLNVNGMKGTLFASSFVRIIKNTDPTVNGGKDILLVCNVTSTDSDENQLRLFAYKDGIQAAPTQIAGFNWDSVNNTNDWRHRSATPMLLAESRSDSQRVACN